ncbi:GrpB family protein [Candidatus Saccharibacteria bacterium]|nr:GrpB family protein [Candidatus Saccharibacteria bacterium]
MSISINSYSPNLIKRFLKEKKRLSTLLPSFVRIEHVGSSAVGIGGKNIVDILIGVPGRKDMEKISKVLTKNGYYEGNDSHDNRIFLASKQEETGEGDYHIHICPVNEESFKDFIILREYLRNNPTKANDYFRKKHEFAAEAGFDRKKYKALKSTYVSDLLSKAKKKAST